MFFIIRNYLNLLLLLIDNKFPVNAFENPLARSCF